MKKPRLSLLTGSSTSFAARATSPSATARATLPPGSAPLLATATSSTTAPSAFPATPLASTGTSASLTPATASSTSATAAPFFTFRCFARFSIELRPLLVAHATPAFRPLDGHFDGAPAAMLLPEITQKVEKGVAGQFAGTTGPAAAAAAAPLPPAATPLRFAVTAARRPFSAARHGFFFGIPPRSKHEKYVQNIAKKFSKKKSRQILTTTKKLLMYFHGDAVLPFLRTLCNLDFIFFAGY